MLSQLLVIGLIAGSIYALAASGLGLIYSTTRFFHFAHGAVYTAGAYLAYSGWLLGLGLYISFPPAVFGQGFRAVVKDSRPFLPSFMRSILRRKLS